MTTLSPNELSPAVFLDRDGTIMRDVNYCADPAAVEIFPGVTAALRKLRDAGFKIVVITNQSGIGRGYFTEQEYRAVEAEVARQVGTELIHATYFCADLPDSNSKRRKPAAGMIEEAQRDHALDLPRSFMIGDKWIDVECGRNAGVRTILIGPGHDKRAGGVCADWQARDFTEAAEIVLQHAI
jgi:D-glycero-D-manno-heptose 1,7-bisphosphate phosphatase